MPASKGCNMKKSGKKELQGKKRKTAASRKSVRRRNSLHLIRGILDIIALHEELRGLDPKSSLAQVLLDRMTPEVRSGESFTLWVVNRIQTDLFKGVPISDLPQFSSDSY